MKLYRSLGCIWTGTQADAKKAQDGKDFEEIDVPTDKPGLMAWLNTFDVRPGDPKPLPVDADYTDELEAALGFAPEPVTDHRPTHGPGGAPICVACARDAKAAGMIANATAGICAKGDLVDVTDVETLDDIIGLAQRRRAALVAAAEDDAEDMLG